MSALAKLAGFAAALAAVFATAALAGGAVDPIRDQAAERPPARMGMDGAHCERPRIAAQAVRGLAVSDGGLTLELDRAAVRPGEPFELAFRITGRGGAAVRDFDVEHTKRMHVVVVRRDMTGFQHIHPTQRPDGTWTVPVTLPDPGSYRVFADFSVGGTPYTLADDLTVDGTVRSHALPASARSVDVDGFHVALGADAGHAGAASELRFNVTRAGRAVAIEDYLGAKGHLVALREGDLAFLHVHPDADRPSFMATFPTAGRYRLFLQFQVAGRIHTAAFTQEVAR
jgi:hypothetical protein